MNNVSPPEKDLSREILNSISLDEIKDKRKNLNEIDIESPKSKGHRSVRSVKLDKAQIVLEPIETVLISAPKNSESLSGVDIKNEIGENQDRKLNKDLSKSHHDEHGKA